MKNGHQIKGQDTCNFAADTRSFDCSRLELLLCDRGMQIFCNKVSGPSSVTRLEMDTYIRVVAWLGVNLRTDAKNASCVSQRLDCVLKRCQAVSIVSINWVEN